MLYTSIPYDKGWTVKVDGQEVETFALQDALLYINLEQGEHTIEFSFFPQGFKIGLLASFAGVMLLVVILLVCMLLKKKAAKQVAVISNEAILDGGFEIGIDAQTESEEIDTAEEIVETPPEETEKEE